MTGLHDKSPPPLKILCIGKEPKKHISVGVLLLYSWTQTRRIFVKNNETMTIIYMAGNIFVRKGTNPTKLNSRGPLHSYYVICCWSPPCLRLYCVQSYTWVCKEISSGIYQMTPLPKKIVTELHRQP